MADSGSPVQLRDSVRKIRKRVVSVIRRGSSSKNIKSRSSEDTDKHEDSEHGPSDSEHAHDRESGHTNSAASSTHSLGKSGSRPSSPQPAGVLTPPHRRLSIAALGFPRSPKNRAKESKESAPSSPTPRVRTFSTPGDVSPVEPTPKLTLPIPNRPRTLSHPLAASPIMPASPKNNRTTSAPGTGGIGALASAASTLAAMAALHPENPRSKSPTPPAVVLSPPTESPSSPKVLSSVPDVIAPNLVTSPTLKLEEPGQPRDLTTQDERGQRAGSPERADGRDSSGHAREPLPREHGADIKRTASTVGSDMGWSMLETTHEEDEPDEGHTNKAKANKDSREQNKAQEAVKTEGSIVTDESGVKVNKDDVEEQAENRNPLQDSTRGLALDAGEELYDGAFVMSPETGTPVQPDPASDIATSGIAIGTPPTEAHPAWISSVSPPRAASPSPYPQVASPPMTPPSQTGNRVFSPERDGGMFSTPDKHATIRASASPWSSQLADTPSRFSDVDASQLGDSTDLPLSSGIQTPPRPHASEPWHYTGDRDSTPPPPAMSDSFFHPRNLDKLNPRHLERSMSTMGVFGDAKPEGASVQERLKRPTHAPRPSIDTSIHEMISPSVRSEENELRKLAGTELREWYEGETRTPKTVRMLLPETEGASTSNGARQRSALAQGYTLGPPAEIHEAQGSNAQDESNKLQPVLAQPRVSAQVQRQPDRSQVYTSVLSRLMSHMDRRSSLMARLATRLGTLGGVGGPIAITERHPREWVAQILPSGKVYWAHSLVRDEIDEVAGPSVARAVTAAPAEGSSKVLVIPTPSAPQPTMLVTDLDMSDPATHSGVNMFVDKNLQERDVDLPSGWEVWIHASGTGESLLDGSKAERWDEVSEAGSEPIDLGYGTPYALVWAYVSHKRRRVGAQGPEDKFVTGEDAEFDLEMERRYWAYVETHPAHADVNPRAAQEAIELLTWHYTDRLLAEKKQGQKECVHVKPPFTPDESHEVLEFLKSVSADYSRANAILKTRTVARVHVRTAEWRLAKLHAVADAVNLEVMSPTERLRRRRAAANPFVGVPLRTLASLLGLGIPYLYVDQPDEKVEDRQRMIVADASTNLMSALMLGASVSFLAIPDLEDIARLAGVAAAACSLGSLAAGIVRLRIPSLSGGKDSGEVTEEEQEPRPSALRTFARSLPLVLSAYAGSALVAGLAAYSWRGQPRWTILLPGYTLTIRGAKTRLGVAGLGASCAATVGLGMALVDSALTRPDRGGRRQAHRV